MIKVPGTPFFPEAVVSFSKAPHFNGYANFRSFWDFVWQSFHPTKLVDIGVSTVETCSINSFLWQIFFVDSSWKHTYSSLNISRIFLPWQAWKASFSLLTVHRLEVLPHACTQSFNKWRSGEKLVSKEAWTPMSQNWRGGEEEVGWAFILSRVSIKTSSLLVSLNIQQTRGKLECTVIFYSWKKSSLNSQFLELK